MSHPNPSHDRENEYPSDDFKPVRKEFEMKKKKVAKKMKPNIKDLMRLVNESADLRRHPMHTKKHLGSPNRSHADLPPGHRDFDNE